MKPLISSLSRPEIVRTSEQLTAMIPLTVPREELCTVMGPGIGELTTAIAAQGIAPTGPWLTHHVTMDPAVFNFEISVPVASSVTPAGRVKPSIWPAMKVARTIYSGPYEGLAEAWGEFDHWIVAQGHTPSEDLWERYLAGPGSSPDSVNFRTELSRPLQS